MKAGFERRREEGEKLTPQGHCESTGCPFPGTSQDQERPRSPAARDEQCRGKVGSKERWREGGSSRRRLTLPRAALGPRPLSFHPFTPTQPERESGAHLTRGLCHGPAWRGGERAGKRRECLGA